MASGEQHTAIHVSHLCVHTKQPTISLEEEARAMDYTEWAVSRSGEGEWGGGEVSRCVRRTLTKSLTKRGKPKPETKLFDQRRYAFKTELYLASSSGFR